MVRLILIANRFTEYDIRVRALEAVAAGVSWVQLRDHEASEEAFEEAARELVDEIRKIAVETKISINGRPEIANVLGVYYHAGRGRSNKAGSGRLTGFSVHDPEEAQKAIAQGADYLIYSPIFPTGSKPGHPGTGIKSLQSICEQFHHIPIYALGGITPDLVPACMAAGAHGVAILSGILHASNVKEATQSYLAQSLTPDT